jgi:hypothetical protein
VVLQMGALEVIVVCLVTGSSVVGKVHVGQVSRCTSKCRVAAGLSGAKESEAAMTAACMRT